MACLDATGGQVVAGTAAALQALNLQQCVGPARRRPGGPNLGRHWLVAVGSRHNLIAHPDAPARARA